MITQTALTITLHDTDIMPVMENVVPTAAEPEGFVPEVADDEVAACLAAITLMLAQEAEAESLAIRPEPALKQNAWKSAGMLEAARVPKISRRSKMPPPAGRSLWAFARGPALAVLVSAMSILGLSNNASAQEAQPYHQFSNFAPQRRAQMMRVLLADGQAQLNVGLPDGATVQDARSGEILAELPGHSQWQMAIKMPGSYSQLWFAGAVRNLQSQRMLLARGPAQYRSVAYISNGISQAANFRDAAAVLKSSTPKFWLPANAQEDAALSRDYLIVPRGRDGVFTLSDKAYRGALLIKAKGGAQMGTLAAINNVDIEDYLLSVVPSEMPSGWAAEALKAQAIAARSYAIANVGKHEADGYDVKANTEDQVYSGVASESLASNQAVAATAGEVIKYGGKTVTAFFHSTSGGCTELGENVWNKALPYLKAVADYDDESPYFSWTRTFSTSDLEAAFARGNRDVGDLLSVFPISRGPSQRVKWLMLAGSRGTQVVSGEEVRAALGLPSSAFNTGTAGGSYVFAGRGFGHGLGMSQWGANRLAKSGYLAEQILSYYFKDIAIEAY